MIAPLSLKLFGDDDGPATAARSTGHILSLLQRCGAPLYALVDAARDGAIQPLLASSQAPRLSLFNDERAEQLAAWSPYLVKVGEQPILEQLVTQGWGSSWAVYLLSERSLKALRRHFARQLIVEHNGAEAYFRFYDPRVLRQHLPSCDDKQLVDLFGDVQTFLLEDDEARLTSFQLDQGALHRAVVS